MDIGFIGVCKWPISWEVNQIMSHNCTQIEYMHLLYMVFFLLTCSCGVFDFPFCSDKKEFKINKIGIKTFVFDEWNI